MMLSSPVAAQVSTLARAHIKCFANMTHHLQTVDMRNRFTRLEQQRQRHEELFMEIARNDLKDTNQKFSIDHFLGGYEQRVFDGQSAILYCDDEKKLLHCDYEDWASHNMKEMSAIGLKYYERENCKLLLK
tara:strand:- start:50 stop:442 length:393 start_codon:yes stop_codon:yes gene_type:complete